MKQFIVRHGYAGEPIANKETLDPTDMARQLKPVGRAALNNLAQYLKDNGLVPLSISASPIVRCQQSAAVLAKAFYGDARAFTTDPNLSIRSPLEQVVIAKARDPKCTRPMLVTHSDDIARLSWLNGEDPDEGQPDPTTTAELRLLSVSRDDFSWKEKLRVRPSDLFGQGYDDDGAIDLFGHAQK